MKQHGWTFLLCASGLFLLLSGCQGHYSVTYVPTEPEPVVEYHLIEPHHPPVIIIQPPEPPVYQELRSE